MESNVLETIKTEKIYNEHVEIAKRLAAERAMFC